MTVSLALGPSNIALFSSSTFGGKRSMRIAVELKKKLKIIITAGNTWDDKRD